jgi:antitoxin MazE6
MTSYTSFMKTAISIPDDLFREVEACSRRLKLSRSRLFATAAREYLARHGTAADATVAWDLAIKQAGQPGEEPAAIAVRKRSHAVIRATMRRAR